MQKDNTTISAYKWIDMVVKERGIKQAEQLLKYNLKSNQYFKASNYWVTAAWNRLNELNPS